MRALTTLLAIALVILAPIDACAQNGDAAPIFFQTLDDVPLMPGLQELEDQAVYFDKPEGRIIEAYAVLNEHSKEDVLIYYRSILPQFGWGASGDAQFYRSGEVLEIGFIADANHPLVKIMIRPSL